MTEEQLIEKDKLFAEKCIKKYKDAVTAALTNNDNTHPFVEAYPIHIMERCVPLYVTVKKFAREHNLKFIKSDCPNSFKMMQDGTNKRGTIIYFELLPRPTLLGNKFKDSMNIFNNKDNYWDNMPAYKHSRILNYNTYKSKDVQLSGFYFYVHGSLAATYSKYYNLFDAYIKLDQKDDNINIAKIEKLLDDEEFQKVVKFEVPEAVEKQF